MFRNGSATSSKTAGYFTGGDYPNVFIRNN